jgi:DNA/RNA-binding domain of Phe-tRNA-synthetase-like protein
MIHLAPDLLSIISPGVLAFEDLTIIERDARLDAPLAAVEAQVRRVPPEERTAVRAMYRQVGLDPTKTRPSSEALLRRVRRGDPLPRINSLVDICNWCSLELQLPYGLYDLDRVEGEITLRFGQPGEEYAGIRKGAVHVGGRLTLVDAAGPFGNPTSDSARTMVTTATRRALMVIFMPRPIRAGLDAALAVSAARVLEYAGGRETGREIVGS